MMVEDEFPQFQKYYRILRKEGVQFPPRDVSSKFMLQSLQIQSPILDNIPITYSPREIKETPEQKIEKTFNSIFGKLVDRKPNISKYLSEKELSEADVELI